MSNLEGIPRSPLRVQRAYFDFPLKNHELKHICFDLQFTQLFCVVSCCFYCCCLFLLTNKSERGPLTNMVVGRESDSLHEFSFQMGQEQPPVLRPLQKSGTTCIATSRHRHKEEIMREKIPPQHSFYSSCHLHVPGLTCPHGIMEESPDSCSYKRACQI